MTPKDGLKQSITLTIASGILVTLRESADRERRTVSNYVENVLVRHFERLTMEPVVKEAMDKFTARTIAEALGMKEEHE